MKKLKATISFEAEFEWDDTYVKEQEVIHELNQSQFRLETPYVGDWPFRSMIHDLIHKIKFHKDE